MGESKLEHGPLSWIVLPVQEVHWLQRAITDCSSSTCVCMVTPEDALKTLEAQEAGGIAHGDSAAVSGDQL